MKRIILFNAIIWAAVLLLISFFVKDHENYKYIFMVLVFAAGLQTSLLNGVKENREKRSC